MGYFTEDKVVLPESESCRQKKLALENRLLKWTLLVVMANAIALFVAGGAWYVLQSDVARLKVESSLTKDKIETIEKNVWKIIHRMGIE